MYQPDTVAAAARDIPGMRYEARKLGEVAKDIGVPMNRLCHHITFDSTTAMADAMTRLGPTGYAHNRRKLEAGTSGVDSEDRAEAARTLKTGSLAWANRSDKYLTKFESVMVHRMSWKVIDAMEGGVPNVPAMLAGHPVHMRRRSRVIRESAPVSILFDMAASAGVSLEIQAQRGALVLALVRILQARRPVNLYVTAGLAGGAPGREEAQEDGAFITCRVDTAPLDLARAGYLMGSADWRYWAFGLAHTVGFDPSGGWGTWPFQKRADHRSIIRSIYDGILPDSDLLTISPAHLRDHDLKDPEIWLERMLKEYGHLGEEAA